MHERLDISNMALTVLFAALGVVFPMLFHLIGLGSVFLPMYLPLALGAFFLNRTNALLLGFVTPLISSLLTGMPPVYPPIAPVMALQLALFCLVISLLAHRRDRSLEPISLPRAFLTIAAALSADRLLFLIFYLLLLPMTGWKTQAYSFFDLIKSFPGMLLLLTVPPLSVNRVSTLLRQRQLHLYENSPKEKGGNSAL